MKRLYAIRGAAGAENTSESITENCVKMCLSIFEKNALKEDDIVSIQFTQTDDLTARNAAAALRLGQDKFDVSKTALFTMQEPKIDNSPKKMLRVLVTAYMEENAERTHIYINGAEKLRPDFSKN